jgi:hypothetical protein
VRRPDEFSDIRTAGAFDSLASDASGGTASVSSGQDDPAAIASDIEQTRAEMSETIEAIQDRLAPERVAEQAKDTAAEVTEQAREAALEVIDHALVEAKAAVRELGDQARAAVRDATVGRVERMASKTNEAAGGLRSSIGATIQQNPIPAALVGLGLGWMLLNRPSTSTASQRDYNDTSRGYQPGYRAGYAPAPSQAGSWPAGGSQSQTGGGIGRSAGEAVGQVQETTGQVVGQVQQTAGQVVDQAQETVGQVVDQVQQTASQARGRLEQMLHENPMQVGALAVVLGGALGLAAPPTSREQELMGSARDRLVGRVQETAQTTLDKVEHVAEEMGDAAAKEAQNQGLTTQS